MFRCHVLVVVRVGSVTPEAFCVRLLRSGSSQSSALVLVDLVADPPPQLGVHHAGWPFTMSRSRRISTPAGLRSDRASAAEITLATARVTRTGCTS